MGKPGWQMTPVEREDRRNRHEAYADQIMDMHMRGESFRAIERATGVPKSTAEHMCKRLAAAYVKDRYGDHTAVLGRELAILDTLTRKNLGRAQNGDKTAADIVLASHIRRSKLLGLDAAVKAELTIRSAQDIEIERLVSMMTSQAPEPAEDPDNALSGHTAPEDTA